MTNTERLIRAINAAIEPQRGFLDAGDMVSCEIVWLKKPGGPDTVQIHPRIQTAVELTTRHIRTA